MKKRKLICLLMGMMVWMTPVASVYAGTINAAEQRIIDTIKKTTFVYEGAEYVATDAGMTDLKLYLVSDEYDLTEKDADKVISKFTDKEYLKMAIDFGYLAPVGGVIPPTSDKPSENEPGKDYDTEIEVTPSGDIKKITKINTEYAGVIKVSVTKDSSWNTKDAVAEYTRKGKKTKSGIQAYINGSYTNLILEVLGDDAKNAEIKVNVNNATGKRAFTIVSDAKNLMAGNELYVLCEGKGGAKTLVNSKVYKVSKKGDLYVTMDSNATYRLVNKAEKDALVKKIKATIAPKAAKKTIVKGKTGTMALKSTLNKKNVKSITYSTSKKLVATVSKTGKITAKKKGTATIKANVILKDGSRKTVSTIITVK